MTKSNDICGVSSKSSEELEEFSSHGTLDFTSSGRQGHSRTGISEIPGTAPLPNLFSQLRTVYSAADLPKNDKSLLAYLCQRVDGKSGLTWVCVRTMAIDTGLSLRTVKSSLKSLSRSGWIHRTPRANKSSTTQLSFSKFQDQQTKNFAVNTSRKPAAGGDRAGRTTSSEGQPMHQPRANLAPGTGNLRTQSTKYLRTTKEEESSHLVPRILDAFSKNSTYSWQNSSDPFQSLKKEFSSTFTEKQLHWAIKQIKGRAKTPPQSHSYWQRSLTRFGKDFQSEIDKFLQDEAKRLLAQVCPIGDIVEELKCKAAENDLPYDPLCVQNAIDAAEFSQRRESELQSELRVGGHR